MTTLLDPTTSTTPYAESADAAHRTRRLLFRLGGAALVAGPALFVAGALTSPPQTSDAAADYIVALGRDPLLTQWSALFFHYGNLLMGAAAVLLPLLVRGRRGRVVTIVGALMAALGFLNTSGAVLSDWWIMEAEGRMPLGQAQQLSEAVLGSPVLAAWSGLQDIALIGVVVALAGLARAGVVRWWLVPAPIVCFAAAFVIPLSLPMLVSAVVALAFAPLAWAGVITLRRAAVAA